MSRVRVPVAVPGANYDVVIGGGVLDDLGATVSEATKAANIALVTDTKVAPLYGIKVTTQLARAGFNVTDLTVPSGESSKSWPMAGQLLEELAAKRLGRGDVVVALGGGVIGDLAGFAAAVYMRGIDFIQVPTTLLAMVDSSVGGKTAVDLAAGKNLVGAFKQPLVVLADTDVLQTLPDGEWQSGMAEVVKSGILDGEEFTGWLEDNAEALSTREPGSVAEAVRRCVAFKAGVVARDEREEGPRESLNYGHTLGHAIEKVAGYGVITHGAAVAEGMRFAARVSMDVAGASAEFVRRQDQLLDRSGLGPLSEWFDPADILQAMRSDKKSRDGRVRMVLTDAPGSWRCDAVADEVVLAHLEAWASKKREG